MTEAIAAQPKRILLATDLSARCDRALDRAVELAHAWNARLFVLHVLEPSVDPYSLRLEQRLPSWQRPLDATALVEEQIRRDMSPLDVKFSVIVDKGEPADVIMHAARSHACDLIVTGLARDETLGRFLIGGTVERLLRRSNVPLLIVRGRARSHYTRIVVGTDFSDCSRHALETALEFFPEQQLTIFHAYDAPLAGLVDNPGTLQSAYGKMAAEICNDFLNSVDISSERRAAIRQLVEPGSPRRLIHQYVRDRGVELVVLGTHGHGTLVDMLLGSTTREILNSLPCDALVVRGGSAQTKQTAAT